MQLTRQIKIDDPANSSYDALRITGKTIDDLRKGINDFELIKDVESFLEEDKVKQSHRCMIAHNNRFDRTFLWALWEKYNKRFPFDLYVDTIPMYRSICKQNGIDSRKTNLTLACETLGIKKMGEAHNAKMDTRHLYMLWQELNKTIDFMDHIKHLPHILE